MQTISPKFYQLKQHLYESSALFNRDIILKMKINILHGSSAGFGEI